MKFLLKYVAGLVEKMDFSNFSKEGLKRYAKIARDNDAHVTLSCVVKSLVTIIALTCMCTISQTYFLTLLALVSLSLRRLLRSGWQESFLAAHSG